MSAISRASVHRAKYPLAGSIPNNPIHIQNVRILCTVWNALSEAERHALRVGIAKVKLPFRL